MLVIADSSPLHYLVLIDQAAILPRLFGRVLIPPMVARELQRDRTPTPIRDWPLPSRPGALDESRPAQLHRRPLRHPEDFQTYPLPLHRRSAIRSQAPVAVSHLTRPATGGGRRIKMTACDSHIKKSNLSAPGRARYVAPRVCRYPKGRWGHDGQDLYLLLGGHGSCLKYERRVT